MSNDKPTRGPCEFLHEDKSDDGTCLISPEYGPESPNDYGGHSGIVDVFHPNEMPEAEWRANKALVRAVFNAASSLPDGYDAVATIERLPELLRACESVLTVCPWIDSEYAAYDQVRNALVACLAKVMGTVRDIEEFSSHVYNAGLREADELDAAIDTCRAEDQGED